MVRVNSILVPTTLVRQNRSIAYKSLYLIWVIVQYHAPPAIDGADSHGNVYFQVPRTANSAKQLEESVQEMREMPGSYPVETTQTCGGGGDKIWQTGAGTMNIHRGDGDIYHNIFDHDASFSSKKRFSSSLYSIDRRGLGYRCNQVINNYLMFRMYTHVFPNMKS